MRYFLLVLLLMSCKDTKTENVILSADDVQAQRLITRVEPPFWWTGFKDGSLQLLVHHKNIGQAKVTLEYEGINLIKSNAADSPNYLFLDLNISPKTEPGVLQLSFSFEDGEVIKYPYEIKERAKDSDQYIGFDSSDVIYLITPDRFANGDSSNDSVAGMNEQGVDRTNGYSRHGGDLQGIIDHLDYIDEMGFTAIWPTPVLENNMPRASYHGYAITDLYGVDPRFGTFEQMHTLSQNLHQREMKFIMDQVANHCGLEHWWMKDLPFKDWVNYQENYESHAEDWSYEFTIQSNHRRTTNQDPYASKVDQKGMEFGWFVKDMPDLNQANPFMAKYIIQNSIWWIETLQLNGIRQDTYPYPNKAFMADWAAAIMQEYPNFSIVGEEWSYNPLLVAYWQAGHPNKDGYQSHLKSTMDFPMQKAIVDGVNEEESWNFGFVKTYEGLANDFAYAAPKDLLVFLDNHDMSRIYTQLGEDLTKTKMALGYLLTMPRIVQLYYGTEILMDDSSNPGDHGLIRTDFPGGWPGDRVNAFSGKNLSEAQKAMQSFTRQLLNYRKNSKAIHQGTTTHFAPENGVYVISRTHGEETVVTILNKNESSMEMNLSRFSEIGLKGKTLRNIVTNEEVIWKDVLRLKEKGVQILSTELIKKTK
jgi:neopullulanase